MTDSMTELLCEMLDERGVVYETYDSESMTWWNTNHGAFVFFARERDGKLLVETSASTEHSLICTPEQAVAATLGAGECENVNEYGYNPCEICGGNVHFKCSECGCNLYLQCDKESTMFDSSGEPISFPRFCPNCGKAVKR